MLRTSLIVSAVLGMALFAAASRAADQQYPEISIEDLKAAIQNKAVTTLDANGTDSYNKGHIPGAINFQKDSANLEQLLPKDKTALVVAYCGGPQCMAYKAAAAKAVELGYSNVKHLTAGISGWTAAGEKIEKPEKTN